MRAAGLGAAVSLCAFMQTACIPAIPRVQADLLPKIVTTQGKTGMPKDLGARDLNAGREVLVRECSGCHLIRPPHRFALERWPELIDEMQQEHQVVLAPEERSQLLSYLAYAQAWRRIEIERREEQRADRKEARGSGSSTSE